MRCIPIFLSVGVVSSILPVFQPMIVPVIIRDKIAVSGIKRGLPCKTVPAFVLESVTTIPVRSVDFFFLITIEYSR